MPKSARKPLSALDVAVRRAAPHLREFVALTPSTWDVDSLPGQVLGFQNDLLRVERLFKKIARATRTTMRSSDDPVMHQRFRIDDARARMGRALVVEAVEWVEHRFAPALKIARAAKEGRS